MARQPMCALACFVALANIALAADYTVTEDDHDTKLATDQLQALVHKRGYVKGSPAVRSPTRRPALSARRDSE